MRDDEMALVEGLYNDNEQLRQRLLEMLRLLEEEVTLRIELEWSEANSERAREEWMVQASNLQRELDATRQSASFRLLAPFRKIRRKLS
jgi:hypothetical protein